MGGKVRELYLNNNKIRGKKTKGNKKLEIIKIIEEIKETEKSNKISKTKS